ncbi:MAG: 30S ribosomal protein S6 [Deltaproteobacteria bacterium]|nr:30S ribosomal protein S6 [Candidatus Zymogenaceae bacterium]
MRTYETVFILDPDLTEDDTEKAINRIQTVIEGQKGRIVLLDNWGKRKLAYRIKKKVKGNYVLIVYYGEPKSVAVLERNLKIMEEVLKFLTINLAATEIDIATEEKKEEERKLAEPNGTGDGATAVSESVPEKDDTQEESSDDDQADVPAEPEE